jgi:hypothetical protein
MCVRRVAATSVGISVTPLLKRTLRAIPDVCQDMGAVGAWRRLRLLLRPLGGRPSRWEIEQTVC